VDEDSANTWRRAPNARFVARAARQTHAVLNSLNPELGRRRREHPAPPVSDVRVPVGQMAEPIEVVGAEMACSSLDALFRPEAVSSVAVCDLSDPRRMGLITRDRHLAVSAGSLGYGRALLTRRQVGEVADWSPLVVDPRDTLLDVVARAMRRPARQRFDDVLVNDVVWSVVSTSQMVRGLVDVLTR
jgi:hypothetical protein